MSFENELFEDETTVWEIKYLEYCSIYEYFEVRDALTLRINIINSVLERMAY